MYKHFLIALLAIAGLVAGWQVGVHRNSSPHPELSGDPAARLLPDTQWANLQGGQNSLQEWQGKVLIVNHWATWCEPCRREIPMFMAMRDKYAEQGLELIGIAHDDDETVRRFVDSMGMDYPQLLAGDMQGRAWLAMLGSNGSLPLTLVFDRQGQLRAKKLGLMSESELNQAVTGLL